MPKYKIGDLVKCQVTGVEKYGFFVFTCDENKYSGLVHISEMSEVFVRNVTEYVNIDDEIIAKIIEIDDDRKKLKLSIKNINYNNDGSSNLKEENGFNKLGAHLQGWIDEALSKIKE